MSSWTALTWHIGIKTAFVTNLSKENIFELLLCRFKILRVIDENAYLKKYNKELIKLSLSATPMLLCIFVSCYEHLNSS